MGSWYKTTVVLLAEMHWIASTFCNVFGACSLVVSFAAVIGIVTQRFSPTGGEALRDDPNNSCEGDQLFVDLSLFNERV